MSASLSLARQGILRHSRWDALLITLALVHGGLLVAAPSAVLIAMGLWWNSNTISHNFIHKPFFRSRSLNTFFGLYLSVLLGIPQSLWRDRHLAHHAGVAWRLRLTRQMVAEAVLVLMMWGTLIALAAQFFVAVYFPGYLLGLGLCSLHGYYEHVRGTISHYGTLYNLLFFNDGYHVEHHARPGTHWTHLKDQHSANCQTSRWPAVLRWLDTFSLESLERWVLHSRLLQRFVIQRHERAFRVLLPPDAVLRRVCVVGGGLFPRTPLILQRLLPGSVIVVMDQSAENIETARGLVGGKLEFVHAIYDSAQSQGFDLVVIPLAFVGDREAIYRSPPAPLVLVHDWIWRRRGKSAVVSWFLLKRLNLVQS